MPEKDYNVHCEGCGHTFTATKGSSLWWKAKKREAQGFLDALCVSGEECGCVQNPRQPEAQFRVLGYTWECQNFDIPFNSFTEAVKTFRRLKNGPNVVFITGVSERVEHKLDSL